MLLLSDFMVRVNVGNYQLAPNDCLIFIASASAMPLFGFILGFLNYFPGRGLHDFLWF